MSLRVLRADPKPIELARTGEQNPAAPTEFMLFANGETPTLKGTFKCSDFACTRVLQAMAAAGRDKLPIDYNHGQVSFMGSSYDAGRAAGWFVPANRDGALWATNVEWTPQGAQALKDREYRLFSPAFLTDDNGNVVELINVALTNLPATLHQTPLVTSAYAGNEEEPMDPILAALLAKHGGSPQALAAAVEQLSTQNTQLVSASQTMNTELTALRAADTARAEANAKQAKKDLIAQLGRDGKLAPALHAVAETWTIEQLQAFGAAAPVAAAAGAAVQASAGAAAASDAALPELDADNGEARKVLRQLKVPLKAYKTEATSRAAIKRRILSRELEPNVVCVPDEDDDGVLVFNPATGKTEKEAA